MPALEACIVRFVSTLMAVLDFFIYMCGIF